MNVIKHLLLLIGLGILSACASGPSYVEFNGIPTNEPISVVVFPGIHAAEEEERVLGKRLLQGAAIGAAAGAEAGADIFNQMGDCGEFFIVCLGLIPIFGAVGMVGGTMVGGIVGLMEDLPKETITSLEHMISTSLSGNALNESLAQKFTLEAEQRWQVSPEAHNKVVIALIGIRAKTVSDDRLAFEIIHAMHVDYGTDMQGTTKPFHYKSQTAAYTINDWKEGGSELFTRSIHTVQDQSIDIFVKLLQNKI